MPIRIFIVTGRLPAFATASRRMRRSRLRLYGRAEPPPRLVTFGTGQPKLRSMWSARSSSTIMRTALPTVAGSTPYSWIERGVSLASKWISCMVLSLRSTSARVVIISLTNSPLPPLNSRHRVRKGALVIPAMGASTTGGDTVCGPIARVDPGAAVGVGIAPLSRIRAVPGAQAGVASAVASTSRQLGGTLGVAVVGAVLAAGVGSSSYADAFVPAARPAWWVLAGCGLAVLVVGALTSGRWARGTALRTAERLESA